MCRVVHCVRVELLSARFTRVELLKASLRSALNCGTVELLDCAIVEKYPCRIRNSLPVKKFPISDIASRFFAALRITIPRECNEPLPIRQFIASVTSTQQFDS